MENRWLNALIKTAILLVIAHIIFLLLGFLIPADIGMLNLPMVWAHWTDSYLDLAIGLVATVIVYLVIYYFFTGNRQERID